MWMVGAVKWNCVYCQMIDSHIASVSYHAYNIIWHLGSYTMKLAVNIFLQVLSTTYSVAIAWLLFIMSTAQYSFSFTLF